MYPLVNNNKLIAIYGPSGAGKTSVVNELVKRDLVLKAITNTTRKPRDGEIDGIHYNFMCREEFILAEKLEYTEYDGNLYGLAKNTIEELLHNNRNSVIVVILEINGIINLKNLYPETKVVFLTASFENLIARMRGRGDSEKEISRRISAPNEANLTITDAIVTSDESLHATVEKMVGLVERIRHKGGYV